MKRRHDRGFTLIEAVVVMVLIGILAVVAIPAFVNIHSNAKQAATEQEMVELQRAIMGDTDFRGYVDDVGSLPSALSDLYGAQEATYNPFLQTGGRRGAYISSADADANGRADMIEDAWGVAYAWNSSTGVLYSYGPDGADDSGTDDDIVLDVDG